MNRRDAISDNMTAYRNLYYYLEGTFDGCEVSHVSRASNEEADNLANIGSQCLPIPPGVFWEEIIERSIKSSKSSTTGEPSQHPTTRSGAGKPGTGSIVEPDRGSHDDRRNLDATILGVYDKQDTTRRYSQGKKDNTTIQSFCCITGQVIQEKHNWHLTAMRHPSRRTRYIKGHPCRSLWASC
jgi:hypothetical protein